MVKNTKKILCQIVFVSLLLCTFLGSGKAVGGINISSSIRYGDVIESAALINEIDPALIAAVIHAESNFNPRARSRKGAKGLMQIDPSTQRYLRLKNAYDPRQNIQAGSRYLKELIGLFEGDLELVLAAYNAGPYSVTKYDGVPPYRETRTYIQRVLAYLDLYRQIFTSELEMS